MMRASFRWRVLIGALVAGFGVFTLSPLIAFALMQQHRVTLHQIHIIAMAVTGVGCVAAGTWQVLRGMAPFDQLRERLADVREGRRARLEGRYPSEVQPLANELNAFLDHRERIVRRAIAKAGDLAHGLKTPLAILTREAERAASAGHSELASLMTQQVERMQQHIDYHLAHARSAASGATAGSRCSVLTSVEGLVRTVQRLYAERSLQIEIDAAPTEQVRAEREDLDEMIGNLLDNACKWGRSRLVVKSWSDDSMVHIAVDDDGPGIIPSLREAALERGVRGDEAAAGSGLGLAIVRELAELYGGSVVLESSTPGGLRVHLTLPK